MGASQAWGHNNTNFKSPREAFGLQKKRKKTDLFTRKVSQVPPPQAPGVPDTRSLTTKEEAFRLHTRTKEPRQTFYTKINKIINETKTKKKKK